MNTITIIDTPDINNNINDTIKEHKTQSISDPLFDESTRRYALFPIQYHKVWELYKKQSSCFWRTEEIDFSKDYVDFLKLKPEEQKVLKRVLAFFSGLDGLVNFNIQQNLINEFVPLEIQMCYGFQVAIENIHNETYSVMLDNLVKEKSEKYELLNSLETIPTIIAMKNFGMKYLDKEVPTYDRLIAYACIEGIMFSGAFAVIFWLKKYYNGLMSGLVKANEFIARDEGLHVEFASMIHNMMLYKSEKDSIKIIRESVKIACDFMEEAMEIKLIGMNSTAMNQYIEYVADCLITSLGFKKIYNVSNPFTFMNTIGMLQKTNMHDSRATEYQKADLSNADNVFDLSPDDF